MSVTEQVNGVLRSELVQLRQSIIGRLEQAGKTATGATAAAIQVLEGGDGPYLQLPSYIFTLESGRAPASNGSGDKQRFIDNLKAWIVAKGISYKDEADLQRLAGFFRWYINKFGTKQYRQGGRNDIITSALERFKESVGGKVAEVYAKELASLTS